MLGSGNKWGDNRPPGWVSGDWIEGPLYINPDTGKLGLKRHGALTELTPDEELQIRTDGVSLTQVPGSPVMLRSPVTEAKLALATAQVAATSSSDVVRERNARVAADSALDVRVTALEGGGGGGGTSLARVMAIGAIRC